jgi:hypothetical protein
MVIHYEPARLCRNSDQPTALTNVLITSASSSRTGEVPLGTPTCSARTRHGRWALYPNGDDAVVVHPGGALAGPPAEVAGALDRLSGDAHDEPGRACVRAIPQFLTDPAAHDPSGWPVPRARAWSRPAVGYWLSGPSNQPGSAGQQPSGWPGAPAHAPLPQVALPSASAPPRVQPDPSPAPAPQRAA